MPTKKLVEADARGRVSLGPLVRPTRYLAEVDDTGVVTLTPVELTPVVLSPVRRRRKSRGAAPTKAADKS